MDGFKSIRAGEHAERGMPVNDKLVMLWAFTRFPNLRLDLTELTCALRRQCRQGDVVSVHNIQPQDDSGDRSVGLAAYLQHISRSVSFLDLTSALRTVGCVQLADVLLVERLERPMLAMTSSDTSKSTPLNKLYSFVRAQLQSGQCSDRLNCIDNFRVFYMKEVETLHHSASRQSAFDKLVVLTYIKVNLYNTSDDKCRAITKLQNDTQRLSRDVPDGLDTRSSDILYCLVMSMTSMANGNFDRAKYHLDEAKSLNTVCNNVFLKFLTLQSQTILYRAMHARDGSFENHRESMSACRLGMSRAVPEPEDVRDPWTTTFMLFSAILLLRIGHMYEILPDNKPTGKDIQEAKEILASAKRQSPSWTPRREMMYKLCMARIHEDYDRDLAIAECEDVIQLAEEGTYTDKEMPNLKKYLDMLLSR